MFTIEHEFDATVITLVDDPATHRQEDITVTAFEDVVTLEQLDPRTDEVQKITFSESQLRDLVAALDLPEGVYQLRLGPEGKT
jgi:HSP20 family molecular chaperone IbpA